MDITNKVKWTVHCAKPLCGAIGVHITGLMKVPLIWYCPEHVDESRAIKRVLH